MANTVWVKFVKGHPSFSYFVGDVVELEKSVVAEYALNKQGYTITPEDEEIEAAKLAIDAEKEAPPRAVGGVVGLQNLVSQQHDQIKKLTEMLGKKEDAKAPPAV